MLHEPILNADFNPCFTRQLLTQLCRCRNFVAAMVRNGMFSATCKFRATMLPQRDVALKVALCAMLHDIDFALKDEVARISQNQTKQYGGQKRTSSVFSKILRE